MARRNSKQHMAKDLVKSDCINLIEGNENIAALASHSQVVLAIIVYTTIQRSIYIPSKESFGKCLI